jgi:acyl-coenzyme A thioesterase PaaI-like protein
MAADMVRVMFRIREEPASGSFLEPSLVRLSGLDLLRTYLSGDQRAPVAHLTGMRPTHVEAGAATSVMPLTDWLRTSHGTIGDGALLIPADSALGSAVHTTLSEATLYTTDRKSVV